MDAAAFLEAGLTGRAELTVGKEHTAPRFDARVRRKLGAA